MSLKGNMGHLEACAAAAGLASLLGTALLAGAVALNAQLQRLGLGCRRKILIVGGEAGMGVIRVQDRVACHRLNAHLVSLLSSHQRDMAFQLPAEVVGRGRAGGRHELRHGSAAGVETGGRLSSFGFSGTIAHSFGGRFARTSREERGMRRTLLLRMDSLFRSQSST